MDADLTAFGHDNVAPDGMVIVSSESGFNFNSAYDNDAIILDHAEMFSNDVSITTDADSVAAAASSGIIQAILCL